MYRLAHRDLSAALDFLSAFCAAGGLQTFTATVTAALLSSFFHRRRNPDELPAPLDRWIRRHSQAARDSSRLPPIQVHSKAEAPSAKLSATASFADTNLLIQGIAARSAGADLTVSSMLRGQRSQPGGLP